MPGEGSPGSCRPGSPRSSERPLKSGWLKKQRSIVKNWQPRYFVLRGHTLYYHKDDKETAFQGSIPLKSTQVNVLPSNPDDPGKFLFEIIPGGSGDRERDSCVLMANSQNEMEEWVRTIRRVIGTASGGVFGKTLADIITYEQRFGPQVVPILVQKCAEFIREHGLSEEGIFRLPGQDNQVKQFRDAFDAGERPSFPSDTDVHTVASLLKLYLRELPEPVVPWAQYQSFLDCSHQLDPSSLAGRDKLEMQISLLPRPNYNLLSYICRFLYEVQLNSKVNKMGVENLATVIGVNLFKPQIEDPVTMMKGTPQIQKLMTVMIRQHESLFPPSKDVVPSPPTKKSEPKSSAPRSFVGWDVADFTSASTTASSLSELTEEEDLAPLRKVREEGEGSECVASTQSSCMSTSFTLAADPWSGSPRKRTQTLPAFNCPYSGWGGRGPDQSTKTQGGSSSPTLPPDKAGQRGTFSEDIFEILGLQKVSECTDTNSEREGRPVGSDKSASVTTASQSNTSKDRYGSDSSSSGSSGSLLEEPPEAAANRKKPLEKTCIPSEKRPVESQDAAEDRMASLLQKNKELMAMVAELRSALEAEKHRVTALESHLRSAELSRDEAQRRNRELDREIQQFLSKPRAGPP